MILGNGLIGRAFSDFHHQPNFLIFASGVSNSLESGPHEFDRERQLLAEALNEYQEKKIVYFGTCSVYDKTVVHRPYVQHKLNMEELVKESGREYFIFRLPNVIGPGGNQNTIVSYLVNQIRSRKKISIWKNAVRNVIDIDDLVQICTKIIQKDDDFRGIVNVANPVSHGIMEIVKRVELFVGVIANSSIDLKGVPFEIELSEFRQEIEEVLNTEKQSIKYIDHLLQKYYQIG